MSRVPTSLLLAVVGIVSLLISGASPASAQAQRVEVTAGGERVIVDGDLVRIEAGGTVTEVRGDWRASGTAYSEDDTERILIDLGAVSVEDRIQVNLAGDVLFDFDSTAIRADAARRLSQLAHVIRGRSVGDVHAIGHTDSIGADEYNDRLSRDRAVAVMSWLKQHEGIPASVMVGSGQGSRQPVAHNAHPDGTDNPAGRARNRRVEIQMATREGVAIGPGVVIAPGGVTVTDRGVRAGNVQVDESGVRAGNVTVDGSGVRAGNVTVDGSGVRVGGVTVGPGGVSVGGTGVSVATEGSRSSDATHYGSTLVCTSGESCKESCSRGNCRMVCESGADCRYACSGGDCAMICESGADCRFSCSGGDCPMTCEPGGTCQFSCSGGNCPFACDGAGGCQSVTCSGGDCSCTGVGC